MVPVAALGPVISSLHFNGLVIDKTSLEEDLQEVNTVENCIGLTGVATVWGFAKGQFVS